MSYSLHAAAAGTFTGMLSSLSKILDKAAEHAAKEGWAAEKLPAARLAPDMFPLTKQVQIACDHAKNAMARLAGQEPPQFADGEQTIGDLKDRIARCLAFVESVPAAAFEGAEDRRIVIPLFNDLVLDMQGAQLLRDWFLPHFYFHVVTAYDILRHMGLTLGKLDYMSHIGGSVRPKDAA
jgi:uncharacterized protein